MKGGLDMPVVIVKTVVGASQEQKERLIERITDAMREVMGKNPETTHVVIEETPEENWGLGGKTVAKIRSGK
jgi:4-oxalocrotonate tautomerase